MKVIKFPILNIFRRLLWVVLSIVNLVIYIPTFFVIFIIMGVFLFCILPIIWIFVGKNITEKIYGFVFKHSNKKLWYVEPWDYDKMKFESMIPIHYKYFQEYIDLILPKDEYKY